MHRTDQTDEIPNCSIKADSQESHRSSYPISSPSFWTEAAKVSVNTKRSRSPSPIKEAPSSLSDKRVRYDPSTSLSYLPNRLDPLLDDSNPHGYLANAEYAPNKFGDIGDYMRKKEIKVQTQNRDIALASALEGVPQIFAGQSFYINGNTHPPMEELRKMILQRGGEVRPVLRNKGMVKFIIAPMLTQSKFKQFERYKVVTEGWIVESCKQGKLLDWSRWKLQPQGGWQAEGRKGLEGFLAGQSTQTRPMQAGEDEGKEPEPPSPIALESAQRLLEPSSTSAAPKSLLQPIPSLFRPSKRPRASAGLSGTVESSRSAAAPSASGPSPPFEVVPIIRIPGALVSPIARNDEGNPVEETGKGGVIRDSTSAQYPRATRGKAMDTSRPAAPIIPISPGAKRSKTSAADEVPPKIQRPEGIWEFYHSSESNEDAARLLKNQEWRLKNTAERGNEGGFIDGYYQNSRLHHLSTWKAELRVLVAAAQRQSEEKSLTQPSSSNFAPFSAANSSLPRNAVSTSAAGEKVIFHVDFDCFFVSCGLATRPHLKGKPAVVCHSQVGKSASSTSEIASASYEARAKGVKNGMSLGRARQLVGDSLETIPYEFDTYKRFSLAFYTVLMGYADELQAVSVDEALIDVTGAVAARAAAPEEASVGEVSKIRDPAVEIAEKIRDEVRALTQGCEVSIGISHNILLAKLGTRRAKPAGVHHVVPAELEALLAPLDVEDLPSIGYSIRSKVEERFGSTVCGELMEHSKGAFRALLGPKTGEMLWGYLRGMDDRKLEPHKERKSISAEMNYGIRFQSDAQAETCITDLAAEVSKRMKQVNAKGRLLTLKLMSRHPDAPLEPPKFLGHGWCETFNKSVQIGNKGGTATDDAAILGMESVKLLRAMKLDSRELRGVGIQITKLDGEKAVEREVGQCTLSFGTKQKELDKEVTPDHLDPVPVAEAEASRIRGIDPEFLAALPVELRQEVERDYVKPPLPVKRASTESVESPSRRTMNAAAHITRQLRPKVKTQMKASAVAELPLYNAWAKAEPVDLTFDDEEIGGYAVSELRDLGIDPEVFTALPDEMRKEIIAEERKKSSQRGILRRPADTSRLRTRDTTRTASLSPSSRGGSVPAHRPLAAVSLPLKPALMKATALPDVLETITKWIDSRKGGPPAERDAGKVQTYLVKCFDPGMGVGAAENAVEALKWMKLELKDRWPGEEAEAGLVWWQTWRRYVEAVNKASVKSLGASITI